MNNLKRLGRKSVVVFAVVSCCCATVEIAPASQCLTACGVEASGNCEELQTIETEWVARLSPVLDIEPAAVCGALRGWQLRQHVYRPSDTVACDDPKAWPMGKSVRCAIGYTHDEGRWVELPDSEWRTNALPHELVHVVELELRGHAGHCEWGKRGIKTALQSITGALDWTRSDCD